MHVVPDNNIRFVVVRNFCCAMSQTTDPIAQPHYGKLLLVVQMCNAQQKFSNICLSLQVWLMADVIMPEWSQQNYLPVLIVILVITYEIQEQIQG